MDDACVIHKEIHKQHFLQHIKSVDPSIQFTVETNKEDEAIPFLDTIVKPEANGTLVYHFVQETYPYRPGPTVGQSPSPLS